MGYRYVYFIALGKQLGYSSDTGNFYNVSLGQGQESVAENAMDQAAQQGHWVILQNIHLVRKWLPALEKKLEYYAEGSHDNYRVFMSAEPAANASSHIIPQGLNLADFSKNFLCKKYFVYLF